jgi:hypothetical protein
LSARGLAVNLASECAFRIDVRHVSIRIPVLKPARTTAPPRRAGAARRAALADSPVTVQTPDGRNLNLTLKEIFDLLAKVSGIPSPKLKVPSWIGFTYAVLENFWSGRILHREPSVPLDGVRMSQHKMWFDASKAVRELGLPRPAVIHLSITDYEVDQRLAKRGRGEDSPGNRQLRIVMYRKQAEVLMPRYPDTITLDASQPPDVVATRIRQALGY